MNNNCLNEFQLKVVKSMNFSTGASNYLTWSSSGNDSWTVFSGSDSSFFVIEGFKNIDLYGVKILANVQSPPSGTAQGIVQDYAFRVYIKGTFPRISGVFNFNSLNATQTIDYIHLTKYQNEIFFNDPVLSFKSLDLGVFQAQGINPRSASNIDLDVFFNIFFYYKYQGEEFVLL